MALVKLTFKWYGVVILGILAMQVSSCGYRFAGQGTLPGGLPDVRVAVFDNHTAETGVETLVTRCLVAEFVRRGVRAGGGWARGHGVLSGSVVAVESHTISRSGQQTALERRVQLTVDATLRDSDGVTLWAATGLTDSDAYTVASDKPVTDQNRAAAIQKIAGRLAEKIYTRMTDGF